ncbi:MAG: translation initiation factor IF-1 [Clostridia bacterium]|nr:translation initiation factor IF-1 [Clostridia bacterium]
MANDDSIKAEGIVIEALPGANFKVQLPNGYIVNAYMAGKVYKSRTRVLVGDKVTVVLSPYDLTHGRIVWRTDVRKSSTNPSSDEN